MGFLLVLIKAVQADLFLFIDFIGTYHVATTAATRATVTAEWFAVSFRRLKTCFAA